jgi:hypothetical protein
MMHRQAAEHARGASDRASDSVDRHAIVQRRVIDHEIAFSQNAGAAERTRHKAVSDRQTRDLEAFRVDHAIGAVAVDREAVGAGPLEFQVQKIRDYRPALQRNHRALQRAEVDRVAVARTFDRCAQRAGAAVIVAIRDGDDVRGLGVGMRPRGGECRAKGHGQEGAFRLREAMRGRFHGGSVTAGRQGRFSRSCFRYGKGVANRSVGWRRGAGSRLKPLLRGQRGFGRRMVAATGR